MCAVNGFTGSHNFTIEQFSKFDERRGPDGTTYYNDNYVSLGHSLLAISPNTTPLRQPWTCPNGDILTWNGEIYGLDEGTFDTQWLGNLISTKSLGALKQYRNWMGAGVVYDVKKLTLTLFRDHFGVKPLYYLQLNGDLFFASTPRALYAVLQDKGKPVKVDDRDWINFQANDRHPFGRHTVIQRIQRLTPGEILTWDIREARFIRRDSFWGSKYTLDMNLNWYPEEMERKFVKTFNEVCNAPGIPKTISLSGGLDSNLIASICRDQDNLDVQSVKYENFRPTDEVVNENMMFEWDLAKRAAKSYGLDFHTAFYPYDNNELVTHGLFALSTPMWDRSRWSTRYLNIKEAASRGRKIYIVGDGADELLTGYNGDYDYFSREKGRPKITKEIVERYAKLDTKWQELRGMLPSHVFGDDLINNRLFVRLMQHVDSFCTTVDHLCGDFGMESRMPFLAQDLAMYLLKIPSAFKLHVPFDLDEETRNLRKGNYKGLLRDHMKSHLPLIIRKRGTKIGFAHPWNARDDERNKSLAQEDLKLLLHQIENHFRFDVDFKNEWDDTVSSDHTNQTNLVVDLSGTNGDNDG